MKVSEAEKLSQSSQTSDRIRVSILQQKTPPLKQDFVTFCLEDLRVVFDVVKVMTTVSKLVAAWKISFVENFPGTPNFQPLCIL